MSAALNIVTLSGKSAASTSGAAKTDASAGSANGADDGKSANGFQDLLAVLLDLFAAKIGATGNSADTSSGTDPAITTAATTDQSSQAKLDLGGVLDLQTILDIKALLAAGKTGGSGDATADATGDKKADGTSNKADPLAAVLDLLIAALQNASGTNPEGKSLSVDGKSGDTLKALNDLLASLTADKSATPATPTAPKPLPSDIIDKLKALDQLLSNQADDPRLAELKSRIDDILGKNAQTEAGKAAANDKTTQSVAALLGQSGDAKANGANAQRDAMVHTLDGAKASLHSSSSTNPDGGNANTSDQKQAQAQSGQAHSASHQAKAGAGFAAQLISDSKDAGQKSDKTTDPVTPLTPQGLERAQQTGLRAIPAAYTQTANRVDMPQIAFEIARHAVAGVTRFQIRLDPPDMGRIDVRLDLDRSGGVSARLTVDRPETFDMLQRDAGALQRALAQTGLDQNKTNLEFSLRQNPFAGQNFNQGQQNGAPDWFGDADSDGATSTEAIAPSPAISLYSGSLRPGGVNLFA